MRQAPLPLRLSLLRACGAMAALLMLTGCSSLPNLFPTTRPSSTDRSSPRRPAKPSPAEPALSRSGDAPSQKPILILQVTFDVLRARVPKGFFSASGKVWNHLDEETIPAETASLLQRNGLRAGRGKLASWAPIKAILETERSVEISQSNITVSNGFPLSLQLDARPREQTLFVFRRDGTWGGRTWPLSCNYLRVEYAIPLTEPDSVSVQVMPELRERPVQSDLVINDLGQLDRPIVEPTRVFRELAFQMQIGPDEFCAIGPSSLAVQRHTAGSLLLCEEIQGRELESMYFLTPRVTRTDHVSAPP